MTKNILKVALLTSMLSTSVMATNGDSLIATGAKARGMGGAQIAVSYGAESAMYNPAMISGAEESISGSLMYFNAEVTANTLAGEKDSKTDASIIPDVTYVSPQQVWVLIIEVMLN